MIIIPIKWLFHWEYTLFSDKPKWPFSIAMLVYQRVLVNLRVAQRVFSTAFPRVPPGRSLDFFGHGKGVVQRGQDEHLQNEARDVVFASSMGPFFGGNQGKPWVFIPIKCREFIYVGNLSCSFSHHPILGISTDGNEPGDGYGIPINEGMDIL